MTDFESKEQELFLEEEFHRERLGYNNDTEVGSEEEYEEESSILF